MKHLFRSALVLLALLGAQIPCPAAEDARSRIEAVLARARLETAAESSTLAAELLALGPRVEHDLFDAFVREIETSGRVTGPRVQTLLAAFDSLGATRWRPILFETFDAAPGLATVRATYAIVGRSGDGQDVPIALYAAKVDRESTLRAELVAAMSAILLRDAAAFGTVESVVSAVTEDLRSALVEAVERTKKPAAARLIARWIEKRPEMRRECLPYLSRLSLSLDGPFPTDIVAPVRALVEAGYEETIHEAVLCAGRLGDSDAVPALIRCLKEGEYALREEALWALHEISGLKMNENPIPWADWFESETRWWANESRRAFAALTGGTKAEKMATLADVSHLCAWRDKLAAEIVIALDDLDEEIALRTATELERLRSKAAVPALLDAMAGDRPAVAAAAHRALVAITRRELPEDPLLCRDVLVSRGR